MVIIVAISVVVVSIAIVTQQQQHSTNDKFGIGTKEAKGLGTWSDPPIRGSGGGGGKRRPLTCSTNCYNSRLRQRAFVCSCDCYTSAATTTTTIQSSQSSSSSSSTNHHKHNQYESCIDDGDGDGDADAADDDDGTTTTDTDHTVSCPALCYDNTDTTSDDWNPGDCSVYCYQHVAQFKKRFRMFIEREGGDYNSYFRVEPQQQQPQQPGGNNTDHGALFYDGNDGDVANNTTVVGGDTSSVLDDDSIQFDDYVGVGGCETWCYRTNIHRKWDPSVCDNSCYENLDQYMRRYAYWLEWTIDDYIDVDDVINDEVEPANDSNIFNWERHREWNEMKYILYNTRAAFHDALYQLVWSLESSSHR